MADPPTTPVEEPKDESLEDSPTAVTPTPAGDSDKQEAITKDATSPGSSGVPAVVIADQAAKAAKTSLRGRITGIRNFYLYIDLLLLAAAAGIIAFALVLHKPPKATKITTGSLTSQQLAQLQGTTTIVGDSKQILDIQGSAVFEGGVLTRGDLNVAGSIKVGGALTLPSVTVTGSGSFGTLQVGSDLSVGGALNLQGALNIKNSLNVQGTTSFGGAVSIGQLSVTSLLISGDLSINRHLSPVGGTPGKTNGSSLGSGGTASVGGSDTAGTITINTGSAPAAGCYITVNFAAKFNSTPHVVVSPSNSDAGGLNYYTNRTSTSFSLCSVNTPAAATNYIFDYVAVD